MSDVSIDPENMNKNLYTSSQQRGSIAVSWRHVLRVLTVYNVCPQSLTGHKNPVECVQFNASEEQVVAGSQSGSIRVWDLEAAKSKTAGSVWIKGCRPPSGPGLTSPFRCCSIIRSNRDEPSHVQFLTEHQAG